MMIFGDLASSEDPKVIVVFAIRSDAYDALEQAKPARRVAAGHAAAARLCRAVPTLRLFRVRRSVWNSAEASWSSILALTERLSADIEAGGGSDALPLLAFTLGAALCRLCRRSGVLKLGDYEAFGGLRGRSTRSWSALSNAQTPTRAFPENGRRDCDAAPWPIRGSPASTPIARARDATRLVAPTSLSRGRATDTLLVEERLLSAERRDRTRRVRQRLPDCDHRADT